MDVINSPTNFVFSSVLKMLPPWASAIPRFQTSHSLYHVAEELGFGLCITRERTLFRQHSIQWAKEKGIKWPSSFCNALDRENWQKGTLCVRVCMRAHKVNIGRNINQINQFGMGNEKKRFIH